MERYEDNATVGRLDAQIAILETISRQLETLTMVQAATAQPNHKRALAEYPGFDWQSIGAQVIDEERPGLATVVEWMGFRFARRSATGKFGNAIWFSRHLEGAADSAVYIRLITFKDWSVEELAEGIKVDAPPARPEPTPREVITAAPPKTERGKAKAQAQPPQPIGHAHAEEYSLLQQAKAVTDQDGYYRLANLILKSGKKMGPRVQEVAKEAGSWSEKAQVLVTLAA